MPKFFISYRRSEPSSDLARKLAARLRREQHDVFIDTNMQVGANWAEEIVSQIQSCDFFVALLSEDARYSEMVQTEIKLAYQNAKERGSPKLLPIRVQYEGSLGYKLDSYLDNIQHITWKDESDFAYMLEQILQVANQIASETEKRSTSSYLVPDAADPRPISTALISIPVGPVSSDAHFILRVAETTIDDVVSCDTRKTLVIKGPRQVGKSTVLIRYAQRCIQRQRLVVFFDFLTIEKSDLHKYENVLSRIGTAIRACAGVSTKEGSLALRNARDLTDFIQEDVLAHIKSPISIIFDNADLVLGTSYQQDIFSMIRSWHNNRANPIYPLSLWHDVDLVISISTEPLLLIHDPYQSPFNVGIMITPTYFTKEQCHDLGRTYSNRFSYTDINKIYNLLNGHPYLTQLAFYHIVKQGSLTLDGLMATAADWNGPFSDHLIALIMTLKQAPKLAIAVRRLIRGSADIKPGTETYYRLNAIGILRYKHQKVALSNALYNLFFQQFL